MSANFAYYIDIVGTCNLRCPSCPTGNFLPPDFTSVPRPTGTMSPELFREIALKIAKHQNPCDSFLGLYNYGEPLLHPKLTKILEISNELNFSPHISTNFSLRVDFNKLLSNKIGGLRVSMSGFSQKAYGQGHRRGDVRLVKSNLYRLRVEMDRKRISFPVEICYHLYRHNSNSSEILSLFELCEELDYHLSPMIAGFVSVEKFIRHLNGSTTEEDLKLIDKLVASPEELVELNNESNSNYCELYDEQIVINHDGSMALCCGVFDPVHFLDEKFLAVNFKDLIKVKKNKADLCGQCIATGTNSAIMQVNSQVMSQKVETMVRNADPSLRLQDGRVTRINLKNEKVEQN